MSDLEIIVPISEEVSISKIEEFYQRLDFSLVSAGIDYKVIFVDISSKDSVKDIVRHLTNSHLSFPYEFNLGKNNLIYHASLHKKKANSRNGKIELFLNKVKENGVSQILEAFKSTTSPYLALIDSNSQYPLEAIAKMYSLLKDYDVVVPKVKKYTTPTFQPKFTTKLYRFFKAKVFKKSDMDIQFDLGLFRRDLVEILYEVGIEEQHNLGLALLLTAQKVGMKIGSVDEEFQGRKENTSILNFLKSSLKSRSENTNSIVNPTYQKFNKNGKVFYKGKEFITYTDLPFGLSAIKVLTLWQKIFLLSFIYFLLFGFFLNISYTLVLIFAFFTILYFSDLVFTIFILYKSVSSSPEIRFKKIELQNLEEKNLPIYSVICPLYKEVEVLPDFIGAISKIDWPKDKLDVILILEEDDYETRTALKDFSLPEYFRILVVPDSLPKTKPKACNFGLMHARGEYLVIYDAEDRPEPLQLKKAYLAFQRVGQDVVCLQSKLNYYNSDQNLLTKLFTAEYSLWFDLILPGLQSINTIIPLGGTSNHFRVDALCKLRGWDPFNVTEDCDLGVRIFKSGYKTAIIDSTTFEEANSNVKSWIRQRSRWIKGYIQTYLVHTRNPLDFVRKHKFHALLFHLIIGARTVFVILNPILWIQTLSYFLFHDIFGPIIESFYPAPIYYFAVVCLVFGNFLYLYNFMIGCAKRRYWYLVKYMFFTPFYWLMSSISALIAFYQLVKKPYFWEKTQHGLHLGILDRQIFSPFTELTPKSNILNPFRFLKFIFIVAKKNFLDFAYLFDDLKISYYLKEGRIKILIFNWRDIKHKWSGGAEVYVHNLAKEWVKRGHKVTIFCGWDGEGRRDEIIDGVKVIRRGGFYTVYLFAFLYYIFKFRGIFDVVIDSENGIPFFSPLFVRIPSILLIYHVHQEIFRKYLPFPLANLASFLESRLVPLVYKKSSVVTISQSSKNEIVQRGWIDEERISIIYPGTDKKLFVQSPKTEYPSFIYLGRLKPWKRVDVAIKAFSLISKKFPEARFTVAGFGESLPSLVKLVRDLGLKDQVDFIGEAPEDKKALLFSKAWAAIQPSLFEGFGITVIEANASGTCVIASDTSGLRDSVVNAKTGILVPVDDIEKLSQAMERIIVDSQLRESLSNAARIWAKNFDWEVSAKKFEEIIKKVVFISQVLPEYSFIGIRV